MQRIKVFYAYSQYRSHRRVAETYLRLMRGVCEIVEDIDSSDIVILHYEPHLFPSFYAACPLLSERYVIGYCVWEASLLPPQYAVGIALVQEIWTCSRYCQDIFASYHNNVQYIPHVITRDIRCASSTLESVRARIGFSTDKRYLLTITKVADPRKNIRGLLKAFSSVESVLEDVMLIVKCLPGEHIPERRSNSKIIVYSALCTDEEINALYLLSSAYVSAHHSEGWGLPLSDALLFNIPLIATGYSGSLEFMTSKLSYPVKARDSPIDDYDCTGFFTPEMRWGDPDLVHMSEMIKYALSLEHEVKKITRNGEMTGAPLETFSSGSVKHLLAGRMAQLTRQILG